jgi:FlaA1/EpsC-like NDP-sugar epimerase
MWSYLKPGGLNIVRIASVVLDLAIAAGSFLLAFLTAYGFNDIRYVPGLTEKTIAFTIVCSICYVIFDVHKGSWRYVSVAELLAVIKAAVVSEVVYTVGAFMISRADNVPRSVPVLSALYLIVGLSATRFAYRLLMEGGWTGFGTGMQPKPKGRNVFLVGVSNSAESFIRSTRRNRSGEIAILGIFDDDPQHATRLIHGIRVLGGLSKLERHIERFGRKGIKLTELIVTEFHPSRQRLSEIVECATSVGLKVTRIPDLTATSSISSNLLVEPKPIQLEDLLGRPEVHADIHGIAKLINGRTVLATGAGGSIGSELCRQIATFSPRQLVITDSSEFHLYLLDKQLRETDPTLPVVTRIVNVCDKARVADVFRKFQPDVVFHAAALKHVPLVEENPLEAIKTNVFGTRNVADAALAAKVRTMVMISTDKAVNPTNIMGATKRAAEAYCQSLDVGSETTRFKTVRFGNVLGSNGSVVPRFREQIASGGPVTVTHPNIVRFFMTIPEAVRLVLHASAHALRLSQQRGKIMVLDMGKPIRIKDLAERMIQLAGYKPHIDIEIAYVGLRPGEKLYEELFDPSEVQDTRTDEGYVVASPRIIDTNLLNRTIANMQAAVDREDKVRAIEFLSHIVPEYKPAIQAEFLQDEVTGERKFAAVDVPVAPDEDF